MTKSSFRARACVKTHTTAIDALSSINAPLAGYFDSEGIHMENPQPFHAGR